MAKLLDNYLGKIDSDTYKIIEGFSSAAFLINNLICDIDILPNVSISSVAYMTQLIFFVNMIYLSKSNNLSKTKDVKHVLICYKEFLLNYKKMNEIFNFTNPIEIYTLYQNLLISGYLSCNKMHSYGKDFYREYPYTLGSNVFTGVSVCRHDASMLCDILNTAGYPSSYLSGVLVPISKFNNEKRNFSCKDTQLKRLQCLHGNHAICYTLFDGNSYFLDPTNNEIFNHVGNQPYNLLAGNKALLKANIYSSRKKINKIKLTKNNLLRPTLSFEMQQQYIENANKIFSENKDIFEQFYKQNVDIYKEVERTLYIKGNY